MSSLTELPSRDTGTDLLFKDRMEALVMHRSKIIHYLHIAGFDEAVSEEAYQNTVVTLHNSWGTISSHNYNDSEFLAYMSSIARNDALALVRKRFQRQVSSASSEIALEQKIDEREPDPAVHVLEENSLHQIMLAISDTVHALHEDGILHAVDLFRVLRESPDIDSMEIASRLGISNAWARKLKSRLFTELRRSDRLTRMANEYKQKAIA